MRNIFLIILCQIVVPLFAQPSNAKFLKIIEDGVVEITIAQGYIEEKQRQKDGSLDYLHNINMNYFKSYFINNQYIKKITKDTSELIFEKERWVNYVTKNNNDTSRLIKLKIKLISPSVKAKNELINGICKSEIFIYQGHGRRGLGPDFDDINEMDGNFVIGDNSKLHKDNKLKLPGDKSYTIVKVGENDLEKLKDTSFTNHPRFWFFNACNTKYYQDELESELLPNKVISNTDILLTKSLISLFSTAATSIKFIDLLLEGKNYDKIPARLFESQQTTLYRSGIYNTNVILSFKPCMYWNYEENPNTEVEEKKKLPSKRG